MNAKVEIPTTHIISGWLDSARQTKQNLWANRMQACLMRAKLDETKIRQLEKRVEELESGALLKAIDGGEK